jgi:hypothetical protein
LIASTLADIGDELMSKVTLKFAVAAVCLSWTNLIFAAGLNSFVGLGLGNTSAEVSGSTGQFASSGAGYRLVAGSQVNPIFSVEAEYIDLGLFPNGTSNVAAKGVALSGVLIIPMSGMFSTFGKMGMARIETTLTPLAGSAPTTPLSDTVIGMSYGYGIQIDVSPTASVRVSWDRYKSSVLASAFTDRIDMNSSALLIFRF